MFEDMARKLTLDKLVNGIQDLIYITDADRRIRYANRPFADIFGYSSEKELDGMPIGALYVDPQHRVLFEDTIFQRGGRVTNYFVYVKRKSGEPFCLSVDSNWIDGDRTKGIEGTGRDLTELVEFLGAFFQINTDGRLLFCSPHFASLFGYEGPESLIGTDMRDLFVEGESLPAICQRILEEPGQPQVLTATRILKGKETQEIRVRLNMGTITQPAKTSSRSSSQIVGYQGTFQDITVSEHAVKALAESQSVQQLLLSKSQDAIYVIQGDKLALVNPAMCSMLGYTEQELLGTQYAEIIHEDDLGMVDDEVRMKLSGEERPPYNFRVIAKTGRERIVRAFSGRCVIEGVDSLYGYLRDVTDTLRREDELRRKIEEHTRSLELALEDNKLLLDTVVHEMDAPTVAIRGTVERLRGGISKGDMPANRQMRKLEDIDDLCQLMFMLERNVSIAESEEAKLKKDVDYWHLERELIAKAVYFMKPLLRNKELPLDRVSVYLRGAPAYMKVNGELFLQVFFNLLSNAVKCAREDPGSFAIEVKSTYFHAEGLTLYFSDWGIGIPKGETKIIFEKRKKGSATRNTPGMGLGLWVAQKILRVYGCSIWVERRVDPTTFAIRIPGYLLTDALPGRET